MKKPIIMLFVFFLGTPAMANEAIGKFTFSTIELAAHSEKEKFTEQYLTFSNIQGLLKKSLIDEEARKKVNKLTSSDWEKSVESDFDFLNEELNGKELIYEKITCEQADFGGIKSQKCSLGFFIGQNEHKVHASIDVQVMLLDKKYHLSRFHPYIEKSLSDHQEQTIKQELAPYAEILSTEKTLAKGFQEYLDISIKALGYGNPDKNKNPKATETEMTTVEKRINMPLPSALKSFYRQYGNGAGKEFESALTINATHEIIGIIDFLKEYSVTKGIDKIEGIKHFNDELMVFSYTGSDPTSLDIFMFDMQGKIYGLYYWDDGFGNTANYLPKLIGYENFEIKMNEYLNTKKLELIYGEELNKSIPPSEEHYLNDIFNPSINN